MGGLYCALKGEKWPFLDAVCTGTALSRPVNPNLTLHTFSLYEALFQSPPQVGSGARDRVAARGTGRPESMYQFSRSIYRELAPAVGIEHSEDVAVTRQRFLRACEESMERLALDRHYFAKPVKTLFGDVRAFFPISEQLRVFRVIERHVELAMEYVDTQARAGVTFDGSPLCCHASTRKGTACQRVPLPGSKYCPSHKHLEEDFEVAAA